MPTITLESGTTVQLDSIGGNTIVIVDNPLAPADMRNLEAGRVVDGALQPAPFAAFSLSPATLRAIADIIETDAS